MATRRNRRVRTNQPTITNRDGIWGATFTITDANRPDTVTTVWINSLIGGVE